MALMDSAERPVIPGHGGFEMSLVALGHHYLRNAMGAEKLYDLSVELSERVNLMGSSYGDHAVGDFRRMLLEVLTDNPGSIEVEEAYLGLYRQELKALVKESSRSESPPGKDLKVPLNFTDPRRSRSAGAGPRLRGK
jgi:hypothetical protein